jgi:hypothetical protein
MITKGPYTLLRIDAKQAGRVLEAQNWEWGACRSPPARETRRQKGNWPHDWKVRLDLMITLIGIVGRRTWTSSYER